MRKGNETKFNRAVIAVLVFGLAILFIDQPWSRAQQQSSGGQSVTVSGSLPAGTNVIGHVIADSGSTTAVTGNVTVTQGTGTNLHVAVDSAPTTAVTGTVSVNALPAGTNLIGYARAQNACGTTAYEAGMQFPPTASTSLTATATCVDTIYANNTTGSAATLTIQDQSTACNSGVCQVFSAFSIPANSNVELPLHGMKFVGGIKWNQGTSNAIVVDIIGNQ